MPPMGVRPRSAADPGSEPRRGPRAGQSRLQLRRAGRTAQGPLVHGERHPSQHHRPRSDGEHRPLRAVRPEPGGQDDVAAQPHGSGSRAESIGTGEGDRRGLPRLDARSGDPRLHDARGRGSEHRLRHDRVSESGPDRFGAPRQRRGPADDGGLPMNDLVESEDELLDPQPAPQAAPRTKAAGVLRRWRAQLPFGADSDPRQRRRAVLACGMALALAAGAGAAGVAVHRADLHRDQSRVQSRILLHLLGGGASMTFLSVDGSGHTVVPDRFDIPLATDFAISVRNDGAQPLDIRAVRIKEPGVDVESYETSATVKPGEAVSVVARGPVDRTAADLPQYPSGVTVTRRTAGSKTRPAGKPTDVALAF